MSIRIDSIEIKDGTQSRLAISEPTVSEYAEAMQAGAVFPPVVVFSDGLKNYLADGFHRVLAAIRAGQTEIAADVRKGTVKDAQWFAVGANTTHGLRRTNSDKRQAVRRALELHPEMSDRAIAEHCGVGNKHVGDMRRELCTEHSCETPTHRVGLDGKTRTVRPPAPDPDPEPEAETFIPAPATTSAPPPAEEPESAQQAAPETESKGREYADWVVQKYVKNLKDVAIAKPRDDWPSIAVAMREVAEWLEQHERDEA